MSLAGASGGGRILNALRAMFRMLTGKAPLTIADQGIVSAANFLTGVIVARMCTIEENGLYALAFTLVVMCNNLQTALVSAAYTIFSPRFSGQDHARYSGSVLFHQLSLAALAVVVLVGVGCLGLGPAGFPAVLRVLSLAILFIMLKEFARQVCFATSRTKTVLVLDAGVSILTVGSLLLLARFGELFAYRAYEVIGVVSGGAAFIWFLVVRRRFAFVRTQVLPDFRMNWGFSKWIFAYNLAYIASNQVYPWLLAAFHGVKANGIFGACATVVFVANPLIIGLGNYLGPKTAHAFAEGGAPELHRTVVMADRFFLVTMILYCLAMTFAGSWILAFLAGGKYTGNGMVITLLSLGQLVWALTVPSNFGLNALERSDVSFKSLLLAMAVMATLGVWLVRIWGPAGMAAGLLAGNIVACIYTRRIFRKQMHVSKAQHATLLCSNRP
jgi:O-antigen/teichoic acid export membrane protein